MPPETTDQHVYFDTLARAERLQLVRHLVRNANEAIYLRGPTGAGKTRFARRLVESFDDEVAVVWLDGAAEDMPTAVAHELGLPQAAALQWPTGTLAGVGDRDLIVVVDDAHRLNPSKVQQLRSLHGAGGKLLLIGQGDVGETLEELAPRFVDLPGFSAEESAAFLRLGAGQLAERVTDELALKAYHDSEGMPGPLLDALSNMAPPALNTSSESAPKPKPSPRPAVWQWFAAAVGVALLAAVLVFQDRVNALIDPSAHEVTGGQEVVAIERQGSPPAPDRVGSSVDESSRAPEITLPELANQITVNEDEVTDEADRPMQEDDTVPVSGEPDNTVRSESSSAEDPLDAVLQDALSAAPLQPLPDDQVVAAGDNGSATELEVTTDTGPGGQPVETSSGPQQVAEEKADPEEAPAEQPERETGLSSKPDVPPKNVVVTPEPESQSPILEPEPAAAPVQGDAWLTSREPDRYTLQMVGGRERASVKKFIRRNGIKPPYAIFERDLNGSPWYSLVAGDYADRDAAVAARARLPRRLHNAGVWPRTFESIFNSK